MDSCSFGKFLNFMLGLSLSTILEEEGLNTFVEETDDYVSQHFTTNPDDLPFLFINGIRYEGENPADVRLKWVLHMMRRITICSIGTYPSYFRRIRLHNQSLPAQSSRKHIHHIIRL